MKILSILVTLSFILISIDLHAINPIPKPRPISTTVSEFLELRYKEYKSQSTKKLKFKDRLSFHLTKKVLREDVKNGRINPESEFDYAEGGFKWSWGGFLLGFFLNAIGVLLVALLFDAPRKNAVICAVIGMILSGGTILSIF